MGMRWKFSSDRIKSKYSAKSCTYNGIKFPSKLERDYYMHLDKLKSNGEISFFLRQINFHLPGNTKYVCDFQVFWTNGEITFEETKGMMTDIAILKIKQVEDLYPVKIKIVKRGDF